MQTADALAELAKLAERKPSLATSCQVLQEAISGLFAEPVAEVAPVLEPALAQDKRAAGLPLLRGETLTFDEKSLRRRWLAVCRAVGRQNANAQAVAEAFDALDPSSLLVEVLAGQPEAVHARAEALKVDAALTATILRLAFFPVLAKIAQAWHGGDSRGTPSWDYGYCPTCGSWPLLGEFRGLEQIRFLRCGLCASGWQFARLRCPFCDNRDHRQLGYFHVEGEESRYRAATCDACHGYVKMVSTLDALSAPQLLVADLATLHLDLAAGERGYFVA
jgi:FdhE protein